MEIAPLEFMEFTVHFIISVIFLFYISCFSSWVMFYFVLVIHQMIDPRDALMWLIFLLLLWVAAGGPTSCG